MPMSTEPKGGQVKFIVTQQNSPDSFPPQVINNDRSLRNQSHLTEVYIYFHLVKGSHPTSLAWKLF